MDIGVNKEHMAVKVFVVSKPRNIVSILLAGILTYLQIKTPSVLKIKIEIMVDKNTANIMNESTT